MVDLVHFYHQLIHYVVREKFKVFMTDPVLYEREWKKWGERESERERK